MRSRYRDKSVGCCTVRLLIGFFALHDHCMCDSDKSILIVSYLILSKRVGTSNTMSVNGAIRDLIVACNAFTLLSLVILIMKR